MKKNLGFFTLLISCILFSQTVPTPNYAYKKDLKNIILEKTDDFRFNYKKIQYIGNIKENIVIEYNDNERYNRLLEKNYRSENFKSLNEEFKKREYENLIIVVDITQETPIVKTSVDTAKISTLEYNAKIDSLNAGLKISSELPLTTKFYDGFPVTIYNLENRERVIGFGNNAALELEVLNKNNVWQKISYIRKYTCGNGIKYFVLKPQEIATVFEPRLSGNFKTKFRYRLGNILSNEFEGNINDKYLE